MKKRVVLEKKRTVSHKKPNMEMVFDPIGTSICLPYTKKGGVWDISKTVADLDVC